MRMMASKAPLEHLRKAQRARAQTTDRIARAYSSGSRLKVLWVRATMIPSEEP